MAHVGIHGRPAEEPCWDRVWPYVLDFWLTVWVVRAPLAALLFGFVLLGLAPQAQDLLVELATDSWWRTLIFFLGLVFVWAMPTHYAARSRALRARYDRWSDSPDRSRLPCHGSRIARFAAERPLGLIECSASASRNERKTCRNLGWTLNRGGPGRDVRFRA
jgi:hypothetical protein